ncbi:small-conductance mechanosensitive channel [Neisseria sp. HSC-16F19]|nr:mechanosensitive ion channel family protein [Neisseria sp. HSC-16F19]MCP2039891.1 small-conductance mechanosensitive channel [Neisseria sp. HSC-16F19]
MWQQITEFLQQSLARSEILQSAIFIVAVVLLRSVLLRGLFKRQPDVDIEIKRRWLVVSRNLAFVACVFGLVTIWATQIQTVALSMLAVAAAVVLATKELIMCLSGSLIRTGTKQYSVGDFIEINGLRGRVVDINLINTLLMQTGPHPLIGQLSGKTVSFPNSLLLSHPVLRDNGNRHFVVHSFDIPVPLALNVDEVVPPLQSKLDELCAPFAEQAARQFAEIQLQKLYITPATEPRVAAVPKDDKVYSVVVRFAAPMAQRQHIQQQLLTHYLRLQYRLQQPKAA